MGIFSNNSITDKGRLLLADVQAGALFTPTRIVIGAGSLPSTVTTQTIMDVIDPIKSLPINKKKRSNDGKCTFGGAYTNEDITEDFYFRELALYAKAVYRGEDGSIISEGDEILYSYGNAGNTADLMPAYSGSTVVEKQIDLVVWIGNNAKVDLTIESGLYVIHEDFDSHAARHAVGGEDPITPESIGAIPLDGSKSMTGPALYMNNRNALVGANNSRAVMNSFDSAGVEDSYRGIVVFNKNASDDIADALYLAVRNHGGGELLYPIFGEHNIPTPEQIGAARKFGEGEGGLPDGTDIATLMDGGTRWFILRDGRSYKNVPADFSGWGVLIIHDKVAMLHQLNTGIIYHSSNIGNNPVPWGKIYNTSNKPKPNEIGATTRTLLWENDDPAAPFAAQTIDIDWKHSDGSWYDGFEVVFIVDSQAVFYGGQPVDVGTTGFIPHCADFDFTVAVRMAVAGSNRYRCVQMYEGAESFKFENVNDGDNAYMVPLYVYGIGGVRV